MIGVLLFACAIMGHVNLKFGSIPRNSYMYPGDELQSSLNSSVALTLEEDYPRRCILWLNRRVLTTWSGGGCYMKFTNDRFSLCVKESDSYWFHVECPYFYEIAVTRDGVSLSADRVRVGVYEQCDNNATACLMFMKGSDDVLRRYYAN